MSKEALVLQLSKELSGQWNVPVLLALEACGGRFTPLQQQLGITPARLSDNLKRMVTAGLVAHIPPQERRHPLLPEYALTEKGRLHREAARTIQAAEEDIGHGRLSAKAWNVPVLLAIDFQYERFQEIRFALEQVTPRMLSVRLDELSGGGLVGKVITETPRPSYLYKLERHVQKPVHRMCKDLCSIV